VQCPEGRTTKACQVWLDKQRTLLKKLKAAEGGGEEDGGDTAAAAAKTPAKPKVCRSGSLLVAKLTRLQKRGVKEVDEEEITPKAKKSKTPRKTKTTPSKLVTAGASCEEETTRRHVSESASALDEVKSEVESEVMAF
jgi:hypothetical protein